MRLPKESPGNPWGDTWLYRLGRYVNEHFKQHIITLMLWRMRALSEDRQRLKQRVRVLEVEARLRDVRLEALTRMMPDATSVLIPASTLNAVRLRAERAEQRTRDLELHSRKQAAERDRERHLRRVAEAGRKRRQ